LTPSIRVAGLTAVGCLSAVGYGVAALALPVSNRPGHVLAFIGLFGLLFLLAAAALPLARATRDTAAPAGRTLGVILLFATLFRLLLVPAGLAGLEMGGSAPTPFGPGPTQPDHPPAPPLLRTLASGLADDLSGHRVAYGKFLLYDDDLWRYLWDGHVQAHGLDPYRRSPAELEAAADRGDARAAALFQNTRWWDVLDNVGFPTYRTVYPPTAQLLFRLARALAPGSVALWKLLLVLLDLGTCLLLVRLLGHLGRPREEVLLYAWNPLVVKELAGSGHVDALMIFLLVLTVERLVARRRETALFPEAAAWTTWAGAALAKVGALVLAPLVVRRTRVRWWWVGPAALAVLALPYLDGVRSLAGALGVYAGEWVANAGAWGLVRWLAEAAGAARPEAWAHGVTRAALGVLVAVTAWRSGVLPEGERSASSLTVHAAFLALAGTVLLAPAVMPWYLLWALPLAVAVGYRSWWLLTGLSLLYYLVYATHAEQAWFRWVEHGGFAVAMVWELRARPRLAGELRWLVGLGRRTDEVAP